MSSRIAIATPIPNARTLSRSVVANGISAATITRPAPVAAAAVSRSPTRTDPRRAPSATNASRVRISSSVEKTIVMANAIVNMLMIDIGSR